MSNDNKNIIHDFDFNLICEYFSSTERQGPGSREMTLKALNCIGIPKPDAIIADLGCGTGSSAMILAETTSAQIIAVDIFDAFLQKVQQRAQAKNLTIRTLHSPMEKLPFAPESVDIIWCEGAIVRTQSLAHIAQRWRPHCLYRCHLAHQRTPRGD